MGLLNKVPFPRSQREFFERLFSPTAGHDHDGVNSKLAAAVADSAVTASKIADGAVTTSKIANSAVTADKLADTASLASLIGAGLGAVKTIAHDTEGSPVAMLGADDVARA